ncbi:MAG: hypothetical protein JWP08_2370 [Bryobacterales bacterium]|jgi:hypothetical protein|nr:hypothetical protein [Bryobacterales bacterium]
MNPQAETALLSAFVAGTITLAGWFITSGLTKRREDDARRQQAALKHLERQIEELYGPLLGLIEQSSAVFAVAIQRRERKDQDSEKAWHYFIEKYFLPLNLQMVKLLSTKVHLRNTDTWPPSYLAFFVHQAQFEGLHNLWADMRVDSSSIKGEGWPKNFSEDVRKTLDDLKARHNDYLRKLGAL